MAVSQSTLPEPAHVASLFSSLLGKAVSAVSVAPLYPVGTPAAWLMVYESGAEKPRALARCEHGLAVYLSAAWRMEPPGQAVRWINEAQRGHMPALVTEGLYDVARVLVHLFPDVPQELQLGGIFREEESGEPMGALPGWAELMRQDPHHRRDYAIEVLGYGKGRMTLFVR